MSVYFRSASRSLLFLATLLILPEKVTLADGTRTHKVAPKLTYMGAYDNGANIERSAALGQNLMMINPSAGKLEKAASMNLKVILYVASVFYRSNLTLRPDYKTRWDAVLKSIEPYKNSIVALYHMDEPMLHVASRDKRSEVTEAQMNQNVIKVNKYIHETFPGVATAVAMTPYEALDPPGYFHSYDWVAFDCYGPWENCDTHGTSIPKLFKFLTSRLSRTQSTFVIPQAFLWTKGKLAKKQKMEDILGQLDQYFNLATSDPSVIAFIPFSAQDYPGLSGYKNFPEIQNKLQGLSRRLHRLQGN